MLSFGPMNRWSSCSQAILHKRNGGHSLACFLASPSRQLHSSGTYFIHGLIWKSASECFHESGSFEKSGAPARTPNSRALTFEDPQGLDPDLPQQPSSPHRDQEPNLFKRTPSARRWPKNVQNHVLEQGRTVVPRKTCLGTSQNPLSFKPFGVWTGGVV